MRAVVQRVSQASVTVDGVTVAEIGRGYLVLLGVTHDDGVSEAQALARKIAGLRLFEDSGGKMNLSLQEVGGALLAVSQFTLYGDVRKGRRPSFTEASTPEHAREIYERFCERLREEGIRVATGIFQAHMQVMLINDGPVTILLDSAQMLSQSSNASGTL